MKPTISKPFKSNDRTFEKVFGLFNKKDYFNVKGLAKVQIGNFERALQKNDKNAQQVLDMFKGDDKKAKEYIIQVIHDRKKEQAFNDYKALKHAVDSIQKGKPEYGAVDYVKRIIHNSSQKYSIALYSALRNKKFTKWKDVHDDIDSLIGESVNEDKFYNTRVQYTDPKSKKKFVGDVVRKDGDEYKVNLGKDGRFEKYILAKAKDLKIVSKSKKRTYESVNEAKKFSVKKLRDDYYPYGLYYDNRLVSGLKSNSKKEVENAIKSISKAMGIKESVNEAYIVLYSPKKGVKPVTTAAYKDKKDAEKWAKDLGGITMIVKKKVKGIDEGKKRYYQQDRVGSAKYTISYHDGKKKHKDGSDFFDIQTFRNKKDLAKFVNALHKGGYVYGFNESVNEDKNQIIQLKKKVNKNEIKFYDALDVVEKKLGKRKYRIFLEKSLKQFGINGNHYDYRTNAAAEEKLFQVAK